jgi:hypothetical protein
MALYTDHIKTQTGNNMKTADYSIKIERHDESRYTARAYAEEHGEVLATAFGSNIAKAIAGLRISDACAEEAVYVNYAGRSCYTIMAGMDYTRASKVADRLTA